MCPRTPPPNSLCVIELALVITQPSLSCWGSRSELCPWTVSGDGAVVSVGEKLHWIPSHPTDMWSQWSCWPCSSPLSLPYCQYITTLRPSLAFRSFLKIRTSQRKFSEKLAMPQFSGCLITWTVILFKAQWAYQDSRIEWLPGSGPSCLLPRLTLSSISLEQLMNPV